VHQLPRPTIYLLYDDDEKEEGGENLKRKLNPRRRSKRLFF
jgi:hypothetical protein